MWNGWDVVLIVGLAFATMFFTQFAILFGAHYLLLPTRNADGVGAAAYSDADLAVRRSTSQS